MHMFMWIITSILLAILLFLLSAFEDKQKEFRENLFSQQDIPTPPLADIFSQSHERLQILNQKINSKIIRLKFSQDKINETRKTISELQMTSEQVKLKYNELLRQLKSELLKKESECQNLLSQILRIANERDRLKIKYLEKQNLTLELSDSESVSSKNGRLHDPSLAIMMTDVCELV